MILEAEDVLPTCRKEESTIDFVEDKDVELPILGHCRIQQIEFDGFRLKAIRPMEVSYFEIFARIDLIHTDAEFLVVMRTVGEIVALHEFCKLRLDASGILLWKDVEVSLGDAVARMVFG